MMEEFVCSISFGFFPSFDPHLGNKEERERRQRERERRQRERERRQRERKKTERERQRE